MSIALHPNAIGDTREITGNARHCNDKQLVTGLLEQCAFAGPTVMSVALNLYPRVGVGQVEVGNIDGIWS